MSVTWCNAYFSVGRTHPVRFIRGWRLQATKLLLAATAFFLPAVSSAQSITGFTLNDVGPVQGIEQLTVQFMTIADDAPSSVMTVYPLHIEDRDTGYGTGFTQGLGTLSMGGDVGVVLGGGIAWKHPRLGLALDVSGRALVSYEAGGIRRRGQN